VAGAWALGVAAAAGVDWTGAGVVVLAAVTVAPVAVCAALAIQEYIEENNRKRRQRGSPLWELRIGIHSGPVVAGVVGRKKFAYDIWGNTVNIASRLESSGEVGRVNISSATYNLIKDSFKCEFRGKILAKNMGEVEMYFVEDQLVEARIV